MSAAEPCIGGVHGIAFGQSARYGVLRLDVVQIAAAAEDRCYITVRTSLFRDTLHVGVDIGVGGEIAVDDFAGFLARNLQSLAQSECRNPVDDTEIGRFRAAAFFVRHFIE